MPETADLSVVDGLERWLGQRRLLLLLDNCEHLVDACAALAARLLAACAGLHILVTSREPLQIAGEQRWRVHPLPAPDPDKPASLAELAVYPAVQLFLTRAQAVAPDFNLTDENASSAAAICARLDGLPLALVVAGATTARYRLLEPVRQYAAQQPGGGGRAGGGAGLRGTSRSGAGRLAGAPRP